MKTANMERETMSARLGMQNDMIRRGHAGGQGLHDHLVRTAEARQRQAQAMVEGVSWLWTNARRSVRRLIEPEVARADARGRRQADRRDPRPRQCRRRVQARPRGPGASGPALHPRAACPPAPAPDRDRPAAVARRPPAGGHRPDARPDRAGGRRHACAPRQALAAAGRTSRASRRGPGELPLAA